MPTKSSQCTGNDQYETVSINLALVQLEKKNELQHNNFSGVSSNCKDKEAAQNDGSASRREAKTVLSRTCSKFAAGQEGVRLWESSVVLCRYLLLYEQELLKHCKIILELGSGCGFCISGLARYSSSSSGYLIATDAGAGPTDLDHLRLNLQLNNVRWLEQSKFTESFTTEDKSDSKNLKNQRHDSWNSKLEVVIGLLMWGLTTQRNSWWESSLRQQVDVLLGSDLIFNGTDIHKVVETVTFLVSVDGVAFFCAPSTRIGLAKFELLLKQSKFSVYKFEIAEDFIKALLAYQTQRENVYGRCIACTANPEELSQFPEAMASSPKTENINLAGSLTRQEQLLTFVKDLFTMFSSGSRSVIDSVDASRHICERCQILSDLSQQKFILFKCVRNDDTMENKAQTCDT